MVHYLTIGFYFIFSFMVMFIVLLALGILIKKLIKILVGK